MKRNFLQSLKADLRILRLNRLYKKYRADIRTHMVDMNTKLGMNVRIEEMATICQDVEIGDNSFVGINSFVGSARIGKFCSIGRNVTVGGYEHPIRKNISSSPILYRQVVGKSELYNDIPKMVCICNDVWVGNNAYVRGGVMIGNGAVIGAGAVVTDDVPDYAIVAGVPAQIIGYRFDTEKITKLLHDKWWNKSQEQLCHIVDERGDVL